MVASVRPLLAICPVSSASTFPLVQDAEPSPPTCFLIEKEGKVEVARKGSTAWSLAQADEKLQTGDRLRTGLRSRATLRWSELSVPPLKGLTTVWIQPPATGTNNPHPDSRSRAAHLFSRQK